MRVTEPLTLYEVETLLDQLARADSTHIAISPTVAGPVALRLSVSGPVTDETP